MKKRFAKFVFEVLTGKIHLVESSRSNSLDGVSSFDFKATH
jgi:hypothetical protein